MQLTEWQRRTAEQVAKAFPLERGKLGRIASGNHLTADNDEPEPLPVALAGQPDKVLWMAVGAAFQNGADACQDCGYCRGFEGAPGERLTECTLGALPFHKPRMCPALAGEEVEA